MKNTAQSVLNASTPLPRRSVLFMPASNSRAVAKARTLNVDTIILDLEDSVLADKDHKQAARQALAKEVAQGGFGYREVLARVNAPDTPWFADDLSQLQDCPVNGFVVPKTESGQQVLDVCAAMDQSRGHRLWVMLETPAGILNAPAICSASDLLDAVLIGTADLAKALKLPDNPERTGLQHALGQTVLAARANGLAVIDGVFMDIADYDGLEYECRQGLDLGFDGKSLIHPAQLDITNRVFSPDEQSIARARELVSAWESSREKDRGVFLHNNKLVEHLHVQQAQSLLDLADKIASRN